MTTLARCNFAVQDEAGNIVDDAEVEVRSEATGSLVQVYSNRAGTSALGNPFTAADGADAGFHVVGGAYKITAFKPGFTRTWRYVAIGTAGETDIDALAAALSVREKITANRTYYVRTDGADSNTGLADTAGGAFLTIAKAMAVVAAIDLGGFAVTVQLRSGTWTENITLPALVGGNGTLVGDATTPSNVHISTTGTCIAASHGAGNLWALSGFKLTAATSGSLIVASQNSRITYGAIEFGSNPGGGRYHILASGGSRVSQVATCFISGGSSAHWGGFDCSSITSQAQTVTFLAAPTFSNAFAFASRCAAMPCNANTFSRYTRVGNTTNGSPIVTNLVDTSKLTVGNLMSGTGVPGATTILSIDGPTQITMSANATASNTGVTLTFEPVGSRYLVQGNSNVNTGGAGATYLPGSTAGATTADNEYV